MDWHLEQVEGATALVVAFTSYGEDGAPPTAHEWRGCLAPVPCHKLFLLDRRQHWYHSGVEGFSRDLPDTAGRIRNLAADLGGRRIMTLGSSMAGYAALRVGGLVRADHVLALAPWTTIDARWRDRYGIQLLEPKVAEAQAAAGPSGCDTVAQYLRGSTPRGVHAVFDPGNIHDRMQAERLKEASPNYRLDMRAGAGHLVGFAMARAGEITRQVQDWHGSESVSEHANRHFPNRVDQTAGGVEDAHANQVGLFGEHDRRHDQVVGRRQIGVAAALQRA